MNHPTHDPREYDRIAKHFDRRLGMYARQAIDEALAFADLKGTELILDTCCGAGELLEIIARRDHRGSMVGVDFSSVMLNVAQYRLRGFPTIGLRHGDIHALHLPSDYFHVVFNTNAFHYLDEPERALSEIYRVLRPHGRFVLVDLAANARLTRLWGRLRRLFRPHYYHLYHSDEMAKLLTQAGFVIVRKKVTRVSFFWSVMLFEAQKPAPGRR